MPKPIWAINVRIYATAYIRAETQEAALEIARKLKDETLEVDGDEMISEASLESPDLPDVSLSPSMTIEGVDDGDVPWFASDGVN